MRSGSGKSAVVRKIALCAMLMALSTVIGILCKDWCTWGVYYRLTFENFPVIIAGFLFGPFWGAAVGAGADVVSCLMSTNPAVNYVITLGAAMVGLCAGIVPLIVKAVSGGIRFRLSLALAVASAHLFGQVIIKSIGKIFYFSMPKEGIFVGAGFSLVVGTVEYFLIRKLLSNREIRSHLSGLSPVLSAENAEEK